MRTMQLIERILTKNPMELVGPLAIFAAIFLIGWVAVARDVCESFPRASLCRVRNWVELGNARLPAPFSVFRPLLGHVQPPIDQHLFVAGDIGHINADLAVVHLARASAPLPRHADRRLSLFEDARWVDDQHAIGPADRRPT